MSKVIHLGDVSIPVTQYASQGNAVLGIRDSGKTYSATYLAEQLYAAKIPFVAFDPSGVWKFLRVPGKGAGLPIVVAGGKSPDLPLSPQSAPEIVRAAMKANVSLVLDFYDIHLSKADWGRIVESCIRVLLYENGEHGLRHIFIEEAAEFCPQQVSGDKARVYAEVEKLARIGGNALLGYTLINQRAEQVNKAVLELCDCLLLHRQKGKNSLNSLAKWLDYSQGGNAKQIVNGLPTLPSGQCWVWPANAEQATLVKMPAKNTFHPDRRALIANPGAANVQRVDATAFVSELKTSLEKFVEEAKANDPKALKSRIAELERELKKPPAVENREFDEAYSKGVTTGHAEGYKRGAADMFDRTREKITAAAKLFGVAQNAITDLYRPITDLQAIAPPDKVPLAAGGRIPPGKPYLAGTVSHEQFVPMKLTGSRTSVPLGIGPVVAHNERPLRMASANDGSLPKGERILLTAIAQFNGAPVEQVQLFVLTGYKSRSITEYVSRLRVKGYVGDTWPITATAAGIEALGPDFTPLPTGDALLRHWRSQLPAGELKVLEVVVSHYPDGINNEDIGSRTDYKSRSITEYISRLKARRLVSRSGGLVRANEDLFS